MRIVAEIPHTTLKITVMHYNAKYTVQFEDAEVSISYVLREGNDIRTVEDVKAFIDEDLIASIQQSMAITREKWQSKLLASMDDIEFETII